MILQPYDMEMGAGTFHPATTLRALGPEPWNAAFVQPCRRPTDGRYGENPNRLQHYYQYQVILKPSPPDLQELYLGSLAAIGIDPLKHDIRFVEDDWESPTLGAWGLGWEVWCDGMEVTQFTYFQQIGGFDCKPVAGELTYGLERLAMYIQGVDSVFDLAFNDEGVTYGDVFLENEREMSAPIISRSPTPTPCSSGSQGRGRECRAASTASCRCRPTTRRSRRATSSTAAGARRDLGRRAPGLYRPRPRPRQGRLPRLDGKQRVGSADDRFPARTPLRGNPRADAGQGVRRSRAAVRRAARRGGPQGRADRDLRHAAPARLDRARPAARDRRRSARSQGPARERAAAGARGLPAQDRPHARPAGRARRACCSRSIEKPGRATADVLAEAIPAIVRAFPWPKSMRWGAASASTESLRWVRPLQGIVALLGDEIVAVRDRRHRSRARPPSATASTIPARSPSAAPTIMPRSCAPATSSSTTPSAALIIATARAHAAADAGLTLVEDEGLVAENAGLTEWPVPLLGQLRPGLPRRAAAR